MKPHPTLSRVLFIALLPLAAALSSARGSEFDVRFSWSADNDLRRGNTPAGEVGVRAMFLDWEGSTPLTDATRFTYGLGWSHFDFSRSSSMAIPGRLQGISVKLGALHTLNSQWRLIVAAAPGFYGDFEGSTGDAFNVPILLVAHYARSRELSWSLGLRIDPFADKPVIPLAGVNWRFASQWEFNLGFPRAGFTYEITPALKLALGATVQGGSFHVANDPRPVAIAINPSLHDTRHDYREIRIGLGFEYRVGESLTLAADVGAITDQKFDYYERGYTLNGDTAAYLTFGVTGRF